MDDIASKLLKNVSSDLIAKIVISLPNKEKKVDIEYAKQLLKFTINKYIKLNDNFIQIFIMLDEYVNNLDKIIVNSQLVKSPKKNITGDVLNEQDFLKKKEKENNLMEIPKNVEKVIKKLTLILMNFHESYQKMKELFLLIYILLFIFSMDILMFLHYIKNFNESDKYNNIIQNYNNKINSMTLKKKKFSNEYCFSITDNLLSLNKIFQKEILYFYSKNTFVSMFYTNKDINKIIKRCFLCKYIRASSGNNANNNINFLKELIFFFILTSFLYYIENDLKVKTEIFNIILKIYKKKKIKNYTLILLYNPYMCKINKLSKHIV
ncbi:hypothetical protein HEP_00284100 [Hepatocystis sp. ex Piliocolobus tephrosceles]|nr:hypothetical protein HEP_00284100 [Hepatocystis sp. ex Piliocolobus tephrosceles]